MHKRKLIKKARSNHKSNGPIDQTEVQSHQSLFDKLKSQNPSLKEEAITILANLHLFVPEFNQPEFIRELINVLYQSNNSIVYQTLFALSNLCEIQPSLVSNLFQNGLDKALTQLSSTDKQLLKPILIFFITIADNLPQNYQYLLIGVQNSLSIEHLKLNSQLCLQFLFRTHNLPHLNQVLSEQLLKEIASIFSSTYNINQKSYAVAILAQSIQNQSKWNGQIQQILTNYMTEMLVCTDLQKQYKMNFAKKEQFTQQKEQKKQIENQDEDQILEQQDICKNQFDTDKIARKQALLKKNQKLKFFMNSLEGTQILLEFLLDVLEANDANSDQQQDEEQVEQFEEQNVQKCSNIKEAKNSCLKELILAFIRQNMLIFPKFLCLSSSVVPSTENIVYLFYNLLMHVDKELGLSTSNNQQNQIQMNELIQISLQNLFKSVQQNGKCDQKGISIQQYEILVQCLQIGLKVLLKNKFVGVRQSFLIQFSRNFMVQRQIFKSIKATQQIKPSWLVMLELYSRMFNPQKNTNITYQQNYEVGQILKQLLVTIPYTNLEDFRCQVIDTLFDVYSNQNFDKTFVQLGFFNLLQTILKQSVNVSAKQSGLKKGKGNKKLKFVNDVLRDVKRFLDYKYKMIKM